jgi:lysophospholipase L1-like esterase
MGNINEIPHVTIVFMGDSITEGQYVVPELRWTDLVAARVRREFESSDSDLHFFYNRGISGETTRQALERFPRDVQNTHPDVMTLQFGLNDCNRWDTDRGLARVSELAYRANLVEMIDRARRFGTRQIILSTNHRTLRNKILANSKTLEENRVIYNEIVREVARETEVTLCDIEKDFVHFTPEQLRENLLPEPDVLHLSPLGHEYYAGLIFPYVLRAILYCLETSQVGSHS